jgi:hypothetical protein
MAIVMMTACLLALFSDTPITRYTFMALPIAAQEIASRRLAARQRLQRLGPAVAGIIR